MIPYDEFKALPVTEADAICAEKMGWHCGADFFGFDGWIDSCGKFIAYAVSDGETHSWSPTTDRNDAAMMVEKAARDGVMRIKFTLMAHDLLDFETYGSAALAAVMAAPCLISYCACVALEEA